ncbi:MAG: L-lactate permease [Verrucomicrobiales bacterium]
MDFFFAALPILFLIVAMTKPGPLPSTVAFFLGSLFALLIGWLWFQHAPALLAAAVLRGLLDALTPISIVFGAILFFVAMEKSGAMATLQTWLRGISANPVAQIMIAGWSFIFVIEGAAGFGTPAALAAPVLVALGFPALRVAVVCLVFNGTSTAFGAAGTPVWFGFDLLTLPRETMLALSWQAGIFQFCAALVVPVLALTLVIPWRTLWQNLGFIYLSIIASVGPMLAVSAFNYEFPAIVGGCVGMVVTIAAARFGFGLHRESSETMRGPIFTRAVVLALIPLLVTVAILLLTRIPQLGLRALLNAREPHLALGLGPVGEFSISGALVLRVVDILGQGLSWTHAMLYVPSIIPFVITAGLALLLCRGSKEIALSTLRETAGRIATPVLALLGALVFVNLLMIGGERSATMVLGQSLASAAGGAWPFFAAFLGALGSFFSGSTTISNLTFGAIQLSIAQDAGIDPPFLLALQLSGAAMGNMICIHNIVAVCAVLGLVNQEGAILKRAAIPCAIYGLVLALVVAVMLL